MFLWLRKVFFYFVLLRWCSSIFSIPFCATFSPGISMKAWEMSICKSAAWRTRRCAGCSSHPHSVGNFIGGHGYLQKGTGSSYLSPFDPLWTNEANGFIILLVVTLLLGRGDLKDVTCDKETYGNMIFLRMAGWSLRRVRISPPLGETVRKHHSKPVLVSCCF